MAMFFGSEAGGRDLALRPADGGKLRHRLRQLCLRARQFQLGTGLVAHFILGAAARFAYPFFVEVFGAFGIIGEDDGLLVLHFDEAARDVDDFFFAAFLRQAHLSCLEDGQQRGVSREDAQFAVVGGGDDTLRLAAIELAVGADHVDVKGFRHRVSPAGLLDGFGFCQHFVDGADHVEGLLRDVVVLAINDALEATDGFFERHVFAG